MPASAAERQALPCAAGSGCRQCGPVRTAPYPGFPTDAQAILMAALLRSRGTTVFEENIFENRYRHVDELARMGARIRVSGRVAVVYRCGDTAGRRRCAARTCGAGRRCAWRPWQPRGRHASREIGHIDRGYEDIAQET